MRAWVVALLIVLALASGLAVDNLLLCPRRVEEKVADRLQRERLAREGEIAELQRRLERAEERARLEAEQRRIADEALRRARIWK